MQRKGKESSAFSAKNRVNPTSQPAAHAGTWYSSMPIGGPMLSPSVDGGSFQVQPPHIAPITSEPNHRRDFDMGSPTQHPPRDLPPLPESDNDLEQDADSVRCCARFTLFNSDDLE